MRTELDRNRLLWESRAPGEDAFAWEELGDEPTRIRALPDDSRALTDRLINAGAETMLEVVPGQLHTFQMGVGRSMAVSEAIERGGRWLQSKLTT